MICQARLTGAHINQEQHLEMLDESIAMTCLICEEPIVADNDSKSTRVKN